MKITKKANNIIIRAYEEAKTNRDEYVTPEHLLYAAVRDNVMADIIRDCGGNSEELRHNLREYLDQYITKVEDGEPQESIGFQRVLYIAGLQVENSGKDTIDVHHLIAAIYNLEESYASYFLEEQGISQRDFLFHLCHDEDEDHSEDKDSHSDSSSEVEETTKESIVEKYTSNLTKLVQTANRDPLIGREDIIDRTIQILCRRSKNNPIHVGEPGVGKTAVTMGLAKLIFEGKVPDKLKNAEIFSLDLGSMLAGTKYRGDFEERIKKVLDEIKNHENPIVYIDEIHNIVGAGALSAGSLDASNLLKPYLMEGKIKFVGATTYDEYKKYFSKDKALSRRFQTIEVKETSVEETIKILEGLKENYEKFHNVRYTKEAIVNAVTLSDKYMNDRHLPDKAIDVIDEAGSYMVMKNKNSNEAAVIDEAAIEEVISKVCGIPKKTVEVNEINSLKNLEAELKKSIFGQDKAIEEVVRCIKMSRAGLNDDNKPVASMLFVGPTGVGKTEIARTLAKNMAIELVRFDMSEYMEKHAASKLIGAPPGYVGYEEGGLLTDTIRKKPHCVLLLDEIEKAHSDILSVLLQVMDYATLTDNQGRKADFRNVVIIMTSNAGARNIGKNLVGFGEREVQGEAIMEEVKKVFTPEFRNRLDRVVVFNHINHAMAINIARKELNNFKEKLYARKVVMGFTEACIEYIADKGTSKEFGAREILRIINAELKPLLIDEILFGRLSDGGSCTMEFSEGRFRLVSL
ncbi:MAG: ATP-dependent Clp protease ATP-binding subunit ClpA [Bacillota bacterium]|nr:ATP-dependent Clp protease ATP-binding subunit ClpA [Bacillota bacterium]